MGVGEAFTAVERFRVAGVARMAEVGALILVEGNFVSGPAAQQQADAVHVGIDVDLEVDTVRSTPAELADVVHEHWFGS